MLITLLHVDVDAIFFLAGLPFSLIRPDTAIKPSIGRFEISSEPSNLVNLQVCQNVSRINPRAEEGAGGNRGRDRGSRKGNPRRR